MLVRRLTCGSQPAQLVCKKRGIHETASHHSETKAVRGAADLEKKNGPMATPIYQTSTFEVTDNDEELRATHTDHFYTRYGNPTNTVAETNNCGAGRCGGGADVLLWHGRDHHDSHGAAEERRPHCGAARYLWRQPISFSRSGCRKWAIETTFVDTTEYEQHARAIRPEHEAALSGIADQSNLRVVDFKKSGCAGQTTRACSA